MGRLTTSEREARRDSVAGWCREANALDARAEAILLTMPETIIHLDAHAADPTTRSERTRGPKQLLLREIAVALAAKNPEPRRLHREADALYWRMVTIWEPGLRVEAERVARYFGIEADDVHQTIMVGWYLAAIRFDPGRGISLGTVARHYVRVTLQRSQLLARGGIYVAHAVAAGGRRPNTQVLSLDVPVRVDGHDSGGDMTYADLIADSGVMEPRGQHPSAWLVSGEVGVSRASDHAALERMVGILDEREAAVVRARYLDPIPEGDEAFGLRSLKSIGAKELGGVSRERARQIEAIAICKLRERFCPATGLAKVPTRHRSDRAA